MSKPSNMSTSSNHPLVSILLPCYNVEAYLPQCLDSILSQTYTNLQIVCIDDGSKDNTWQILQEYAAKDSHLEIYHQENMGVATTRNHLLKKVKGDYVLFVDSDDWIEPDMCFFLVNKAIATNSSIVTCGMVKNNEPLDITVQNEEIWDRSKVVLEFLRHIRFNGSLCNKLLKTSLIHNVSFNCGISYGEDALFCWYLLQNCIKVVVTNRQLYHYRMNSNSLSHLSWTPEKKGSGHLVWKIISDEANHLWSQYADIAKARYAIEDMWSLYYSSLSNYPYDEHIKARQINIRQHLPLIIESGLISINKILTAFALAYCYPLGKLLKYTRK